MGVDIRPAASDDEAAAIVAAIELVWPRPAPADPARAERAPRAPVWRFSGRWWAKPVAARRERPWSTA